jgi:hypothetical protein
VPLCPPQTTHACRDANPGRRGGKPETNRLSYGTAQPQVPSPDPKTAKFRSLLSLQSRA